MRAVDGKVAVITGAGSGIGRALAVDLAQRGARVVVQDVDEVGLAGTVSRLGGDVLAQRVDVSDPESVQQGLREVLDRHGVVDVLINNAGIAHGGVPFWELPEADFARVLDVNLWGVVHGTRAYLPHLMTRPAAAVVNLSSVFGIVGVGRQSAYCLSKFAVRGFTESLRMELRQSAPHVRTVSVHPGGVKTAIARNSLRSGQDPTVREAEIRAFEDLLSRTSPEKAAATIVAGLLAGKERVLIGPDARVLDLLARTLPRRYTGLLARAAARSGQMPSTGPAAAPGEQTVAAPRG